RADGGAAAAQPARRRATGCGMGVDGRRRATPQRRRLHRGAALPDADRLDSPGRQRLRRRRFTGRHQGMVSSHLRLITLAAMLALGACTMTPLAPQKDYEPVVIPESSPAHSLLDAARSARSRGDTGAAGRYLERALGMAGTGEATVLYREL